MKDEVHKGDWGVDHGQAITQTIVNQIRGAYGPPAIGTDDAKAFDYLLRWSIMQGQIPDGPEEDHDGAAAAISARGGGEEE